MIESSHTMVRLRCDGCRTAWLSVELKPNQDVYEAAADYGWTRIHELDHCPRCKRKLADR